MKITSLVLAAFVATGIPHLLAPPWIFANYMAFPLRFAGMPEKEALYVALKSYLPVGLSLVVAGMLPIWSSGAKVWRLYLLSLVACMLLVSLTAPFPGLRYISNLFPLAVVAGALTLGWLVRSAAAREFWKTPGGSGLRQHVYPLTCLVLALHLGLVGEWDPREAFGSRLLAPDQRPHHDYIEQHFREGDLVISLEPGLTSAYLGRPADFFLREKRDREGGFRPFTAREKSSSATPVIDSPALLRQVLEGHGGRVWVYLNRKVDAALSRKTKRILKPFPTAFSTLDGVVLLRDSHGPSDR